MHKLSLLLSITAVCCLNGIQAQQPTYPQWWLDQGIVTAQPPAAPGEPGHDPATWDAWMAGNFAPANVGQAKNFAKAARDAMEAAQAGSAGTTIANMITGFSIAPEDNYVPLNLGQLKALAAPFYDVLGANSSFAIILGDGTVIPNGSYPWNPATPIADNYAPANLGQLKHVFSFDLSGWNPTPSNQVPIVDAGSDFELTVEPAAFALNGTASDPDDGPSPLTITWSQLSGPGTVSFSDSQSLISEVSFDVAGTYTLQLSAFDGADTVTDELSVIVHSDTDGNGIDDAIDDAWAQLMSSNPDFISLSQVEYYDPDNILGGLTSSPEDDLEFSPVKPYDTIDIAPIQWDYDGDGISNYLEYLNGTDPADFFDGQSATLYITYGDGATAAPDTYIDGRLYVIVYDENQEPIENAPVKFHTVGGGSLLSKSRDIEITERSAVRYTRSSEHGAASAYTMPSSLGTSQVIATLPNGNSVTFTLYAVTIDQAERPAVTNFEILDNGDGTKTYFWISQAEHGEWFQIEERQDNGTWKPMFQTHYGSTELPLSATNSYSITLDDNYQLTL